MPVAAAPPELVTLTSMPALVWPTVTLPNASTGGADCRFAVGAAVPVPESAMTMLPPPVKLIVSDALSAPVPEGAYATLSAHDAPALIVAPQVLPLTTNSVALLLAKATPVAAAPPVLVTLTDWLPLVAPTVTVPNASEAGVAFNTATGAAVPVPDIATVTGEAPA